MNRLILDINKNVELTAFYTKVNEILYVKNVYLYENGLETKSTTDISANCIDELKDKLKKEYSSNRVNCCTICGKEFEEGQQIFKTESGERACSLTELLSHLSGKEVS